MDTLRLDAITRRTAAPRLHLVAREPESPWEARGFADLVPPDTLEEARLRRDVLARLLTREREAAADFLLALGDFDRRRGWKRLGHASLFSFLTRELGLSKGAAFLRLSAARLLPHHPAAERALRSGALCLSAVGELAKVLTRENEADVLPRFLGCSTREAREVVAALAPRAAPPVREVVTRLPPAPAAAVPTAMLTPDLPQVVEASDLERGTTTHDFTAGAVLTSEPLPALPARTKPLAPPAAHSPAIQRAPAASVEPLTADLRRLHVTVSRAFLDKVARARTGLSHARRGATTEEVLEAALDALLERQARRNALVKRPRSAPPTSTPTSTPASTSESTSSPTPTASRARRPHVPAAVERAVRLRDGDRCQHPLDAGGVCGSTWFIELDHVLPLALGGPTTVENLRCACASHNRSAAEDALGAAARQRRRR